MFDSGYVNGSVNDPAVSLYLQAGQGGINEGLILSTQWLSSPKDIANEA